MTFPEVQFVAAPEDGAEVLFDFNDNMPGEAPAQIVAGTFTLGTPSVIGDPDGLGVQYGPREVGFTLLIFGNRQAAMETQALLARTFMLRRRGWLRVQMDDYSSPVWLRTYTPTPAELDFSLISPDSVEDAWQIEVAVAAEPFIRGERIELWSGTINNNPAHATNPMGVTLPPVIGDAPAPLRISALFSATRNYSDVVWSCAAVPDGYAPIVWQIGTGDGWSVQNNTSAGIAGATRSGGSARSLDFATQPVMAGRVFGTAPSTPPVGKYRVRLRVARDPSVGVVAFRLGYRTPAGDRFDGSQTVVVDVNHDTWVDLGEFEFPMPRPDVSMPAEQGVPNIRLDAQAVSGTPTTVVDAFLLTPVDLADVATLEPWEKCDTLVTEFGQYGPQSGVGDVQVWDGEASATLRQDSLGRLDALSVASASRGTFPTVRPGVANHLTLVQQARIVSGGSSPDTDAIAASADVSVSYQPHWLWLGV